MGRMEEQEDEFLAELLRLHREEGWHLWTMKREYGHLFAVLVGEQEE